MNITTEKITKLTLNSTVMQRRYEIDHLSRPHTWAKLNIPNLILWSTEPVTKNMPPGLKEPQRISDDLDVNFSRKHCFRPATLPLNHYRIILGEITDYMETHLNISFCKV